MSGSTAPAVRLFGSEVRAKVLGVLAESREPKTGYEVSKILDTYPSKVYAALRDLEDTPFVEVVGGARGKRYLLADEDLRKLLLRTVRIAAEDDWFADRARRIEEGRMALERLPPMEVPRFSGEPGSRARAVLREFARPREKDKILAKMGLRTVRRRIKRVARD
jgi:DNA-binding PadR family transcriptional regulator